MGVVVPEGLIAHGRGEAFDYFLGERTTPSARRAIHAAAQWMVHARRPVLSVNGNVAALAADRVARLSRALPRLGVEVNLFHRTPARARRIGAILRRAGVRRVLGLRPNARIPGLPSDRAFVDREGIFVADVCVVPLEDGDRTEALRAMGKRVISIDLNPLSRTSVSADLPIVDELRRALQALAEEVARPPRRGSKRFATVDRKALLAAARRTMARSLTRGPTGRVRAAVGRRSTRSASSPRVPGRRRR